MHVLEIFLSEISKVSGLLVTVCSAPVSLDDDRDDQELFDDLNDDTELEESQM